MLVTFALENYACFRDRQELNTQAVARTSDVHAFDSHCPQAPRLNRVTAIYGPNGSGKSRLLTAMMIVKQLVLGSAKDRHEGEHLPYTPFLFDKRTRTQPTTFETCFIEEGTYYEYRFSHDRDGIHDETLFGWPPGGRKRMLLERHRTPNTNTDDIEFGGSVTGPKSVWRQSTRPNALLVSVATQLNSDVFSPVVRWFRRLAGISTEYLSEQFTAKAVFESEERRTRVLQLLRDADIAVAEFSVHKETQRLEAIKDDVPPNVVRSLSQTGVNSFDTFQTRFAHAPPGASEKHLVDLDDESDGTQRLFALALPWIDMLENDRVIIVDELDKSLHPLLVDALLRRINKEHEGHGRAQLVATLHNTSMMPDPLARGQVWLTDKDRPSEAATLTPLSDYRPRKGEAIERGYLAGRYGGIPITSTVHYAPTT